jgi:uncharacterized membrane protein
MESKAKLAGHPIHPMLVVFPLGLLAGSFAFDLVHLATGNEHLGHASFYMITAGVLTALLAAAFGLVDFLAIPRHTRARRVGALHGGGNLVVVALFMFSWGMRYADPAQPGGLAVLLSLLGVLTALVTGWLGGELVDRLGVGVDDGAHLDAPSSLSKRPAAERWSPGGTMQPRRAT